MINKFLYKIVGLLLFCGSVLSFTSCDDVNDWATDDNENGIFSPVIFETSDVAATSVSLKFSSVPNAGKYIFEFSKDSLQFASIDRTVEIDAEDLVKDSTDTKIRYIFTVKKLDAEIRYSVRLKVTGNNGLPDSKWVSLTFKTKGEQILNAVKDISEDSALLTWDPENDVTHITLTENNGTAQKIDLTTEEISLGQKSLSGLKENTSYSVQIFNNEIKRGTVSFTTQPKVSGDGVKYFLTGDEDLATYLDNITDDAVILVFPGGSSYTINSADGNWSIPAHIKSLTLWGLPSGDDKVQLNLKSIKLDDSSVSFKLWAYNLKITGTDNSADYILNDNPSGARSLPEFKIDNCTVNTFRGMMRLRGAVNISRFEITNSIVSNIGSYGVLTVDAATVSVGNVVISNSTIYNLLSANVLTFKSQASSLNITNCTLYDAPSKGKYIVSFDKAASIPSTFNITSCIFGASDAANEIRATTPKITTTFVTDSYKTSDLSINTGYPLTGVSEYSKTSADLFVDPANGDFTIKDTNIGNGNNPGDPRWWN